MVAVDVGGLLSLMRVKVCVDCGVSLWLSRHVVLVGYKSVEDWFFEFWLVVGGFAVLRLFGGVHRGFEEFRCVAWLQGRLDDVEELALFEEQDRLEAGD